MTMKQLLLAVNVTVGLSLAACVEGWSSTSRALICRQTSAMAVPFRRRRIITSSLVCHSLQHRRHCWAQSPQLFRSSRSLVLYARKENGATSSSSGDLRVLYNDDAFGLVFLSALFVAKDYTFATCFGLLSMVAAIVIQFAGVKFQPTFPGLVAIAAFLITLVLGNVVGPVVMEQKVAVLTEIAVCAISLVWGLVQATKRPSG